MGITKEFAILAPVPSVHLASAMETCDRRSAPIREAHLSAKRTYPRSAPIREAHLSAKRTYRKGQVAFGSSAWELFRQVEQMKKSDLVEVFIYPSLVGYGGSISISYLAA
ncbi:MAG: hypothetical protein F6J93_26325 [Oscillatoria sp. SIO1A7]|nr:hypothetical protein [Oscillatoria sp. SIO1A7]